MMTPEERYASKLRRGREYFARHREALNARRSARYHAQREKILAEKREWYHANKHKPEFKAYVRQAALKRNYGLSESDYARLVQIQGGKCAICGDIPKKLYVDHDHLTGEVRELLCPRCNCGLRDAKWMRACLAYVDRHEELSRRRQEMAS